MLGVGRAGPRLDPSGLAPDRTGGTGAGEVPGGPVVRSSAAAPSGDRAEREAWAILASVSGLGPLTFGALLERLGSARAVVETAGGPRGVRALTLALATAPGGLPTRVNGELLERISGAASTGDGLLERLESEGISIVILDDAAYPSRLRAIEMPPPTLFVRGDPAVLSLARAVAVVGTRRPTDAGRHVASRIAGAIARLGASVVSGLAVGIDGAAHAAALAEAGRTVAVLGGGHGRIYPRAHARLAGAIVAEGGAILSEFPPETEPTPGTFPRRNRLISGLSEATVIVEAAARSGALITASWALEQGRPCFLVPGSIDAPTSRGCLAFLREWPGEARIVAGVPELLEDLGLAVAASGVDRGHASGPSAGSAVLAELGATERLIATALVEGLATVDELAAGSSLPVATILGTLTLLEMRGLAVGAYGRYRPTGRLATADPGGRGRRRPPRPTDPIGERGFAAPVDRVLR